MDPRISVYLTNADPHISVNLRNMEFNKSVNLIDVEPNKSEMTTRKRSKPNCLEVFRT